ncbi:MAG: SpoIID/LytB domain-containing protein, partial [Candidatus Obscuribacterales bacterium]|nr:SpoIID/LytB domain-containing protein [Candidatus Obscuribacterales bacterium]
MKTKLWRTFLLVLIALWSSTVGGVETAFAYGQEDDSPVGHEQGGKIALSDNLGFELSSKVFFDRFDRRDLATVLNISSGNRTGDALVVRQNWEQGPAKKRLAVRVAIALGVGAIDFVSFDGAQVKDVGTGNLVAELKPASRWKVAPSVLFGNQAIAMIPERNIDQELIVTGFDLQPEKKAAYLPTVAPDLSLPIVLTAGAAQMNAKSGSSGSAVAVPLRANAAAFSNASNLDGLLRVGSSAGGMLIVPHDYGRREDQSVFSINGHSYRGALLITANQVVTAKGKRISSFNAINIVDLEDYLLSVLPSEMPAGWPLEALKAQAIAARSYVMANLGKYESEGYDVRATVSDQVYKGVAWEKDTSNRAVCETSGIVLKHGNEVVPAFFHSSAGGFTELSQHVWSKPLPYLRSVKDFDDSSPHYLWHKKYSISELEKSIGQGVGPITAMFTVDRSPSNRVKQLLVIGGNGSRLIGGNELRQVLKLPGTNFNIVPDSNSYVFSGQGFGHGL